MWQTLYFRMKISDLIVQLSQNPNRAGRRQPSTAFRKELASLQSPKSSPKVERANTPSSVQPTPAKTRTSSSPTIWSSFFRVYQALSRASQVARQRGPKGSFTTSATRSQLTAIMQSHRPLLAPKLRSLISTDCSSRLAQTSSPQNSLSAPRMVGSAFDVDLITYFTLCFQFLQHIVFM